MFSTIKSEYPLKKGMEATIMDKQTKDRGSCPVCSWTDWDKVYFRRPGRG